MIMPVFAPHDNHGALIRDIARPTYRVYGRGFSLAAHTEKVGLHDIIPPRRAAPSPRRILGNCRVEETGHGAAWRQQRQLDSTS